MQFRRGVCFFLLGMALSLEPLAAQPSGTRRLALSWEFQNGGMAVSLRGLDVASDKIAWVSGSGGHYARTDDGGATWQPGQVPGADSLDFRDLHAFDERRALLLAAGPGEKSRIYLTRDGGKTWHIRFINPHPAGFFCALTFWDERRGIAFSDPVEGRFRVILTADAGENWQEVDPAGLPPAREGEYAFAASGTCLSVQDRGHAWFGSGGSAARMFHSRDGGHTWTVHPTPMPAGEPSRGIFSVAFRDAQNGVAVGGDYRQPEKTGGNVLRSADGGHHWDTIAGAEGVGYRSCVRYVNFGTQRLLLAVGRAGCSFSPDDGYTWQNFGDSGFYVCDADPDGKLILAAGADGRIARLRISP